MNTAQPALASPLRVWSPNTSNKHRNHTVKAAIQMKNQKDQSRTSPKSLVMASMSCLSSERGRGGRKDWQSTRSSALTRTGWGVPAHVGSNVASAGAFSPLATGSCGRDGVAAACEEATDGRTRRRSDPARAHGRADERVQPVLPGQAR